MDNIIAKELKDIKITCICNDNKEHVISLCDFINVKDSAITINNDNNIERQIDISVSCDEYSVNIIV